MMRIRVNQHLDMVVAGERVTATRGSVVSVSPELAHALLEQGRGVMIGTFEPETAEPSPKPSESETSKKQKRK